MPLAFMFTFSHDGTASEGAKQRLLCDVFKWLIQNGLENVICTHTDKDWSQINALRSEFPSARLQTCYYHAMDYIETRLNSNEPPGHYDPRKAHLEFLFIDPTWAPGVTRIGNEDDLPNTERQKQDDEVRISSSL